MIANIIINPFLSHQIKYCLKNCQVFYHFLNEEKTSAEEVSHTFLLA